MNIFVDVEPMQPDTYLWRRGRTGLLALTQLPAEPSRPQRLEFFDSLF